MMTLFTGMGIFILWVDKGDNMNKERSQLAEAIMEFIKEAPSFPRDEELAVKIAELLRDPRAVTEHLISISQKRLSSL